MTRSVLSLGLLLLFVAPLTVQPVMNRILKAIGVVILLALIMGVIAWVLVDVFGWEIPEWAALTLGYLFAWPLLLLDPFIPASDSRAPYASLVRQVLYLFALLLDIGFYSFLVYVAMYGRVKDKRVLAKE